VDPVDVAREVPAALVAHQSVRDVRLVGSRGSGSAHELSDWDFAVYADDFEPVARDLHELVAPLRPLSEQWDPYSKVECYMLLLPGPTKIDLLFPQCTREWSPAWEPSPETLEAIDRHFWDWILWLEQKRRGGRHHVLEKSARDMHRLMLRPMGVDAEPASISDAVDAYLAARDALERRYGIRVPRELEREVRPVVHRG
jgi:predicted nucleotidyltransferase